LWFGGQSTLGATVTESDGRRASRGSGMALRLAIEPPFDTSSSAGKMIQGR
jgi:hypothetical protein